MAFKAQIIADSISMEDFRITTFEATMPRIILAELNTHRDFSRNSASTRAIMTTTLLENVLREPFIPEKFGVNQPGMQAFSHLAGLRHDEAVERWLAGLGRAATTVIELLIGTKESAKLFGYNPSREYVDHSTILGKLDELKQTIPKSTESIDPTDTRLNVHKQLAGRHLETYSWQTVIITATELTNFFKLRDHADAQGEIATIARMMRQVYAESTPRYRTANDWHTPYVEDDEFPTIEERLMASTSRCAAVSYLRQDRKDPEKDRRRYDKLRQSGHWSPFEHQAKPMSLAEWQARQNLILDATARDMLFTIDDDIISDIQQSLEKSANYRGWVSQRRHIERQTGTVVVR
ncbi:hypothetical protein B7Y94_01390 [Candidatus Saccharibacteria bacterium 32-49-12]|nr:MAG: hypothetical protein B7Y94_01390 [Candidatus Saccharibacteria bacterium 32-49-12]